MGEVRDNQARKQAPVAREPPSPPWPPFPGGRVNVTRHTGDAGEIRLSVAGELDLSTVDQLQQQVGQELLTDRLPQRLVLDLAGLTFCDSTELSAMLAAQMAGAEHGVAVRWPTRAV